jgi:hypothetical protein
MRKLIIDEENTLKNCSMKRVKELRSSWMTHFITSTNDLFEEFRFKKDENG